MARARQLLLNEVIGCMVVEEASVSPDSKNVEILGVGGTLVEIADLLAGGRMAFQLHDGREESYQVFSFEASIDDVEIWLDRAMSATKIRLRGDIYSNDIGVFATIDEYD